MSNLSVVVDLKAYEQSRRGLSAGSLALLHTCRDSLIEGTLRQLTGHYTDMEQTLLDLADHTPLQDARSTYYSALTLLQRQGSALAAECRSACLAAMTPAAGSAAHTQRGGELSLVGDDDYEAALAVEKTATRWRYAGAEAFLPFDARIGAMLGQPGLAEADNPLGPRTLCQALFDGIGRLESGLPVRVVLLAQFDRWLVDRLGELYQEQNRYLIEQGVLPDLKLGTLQQRPSRAARAAAEDARSAGEEAELFDALARRFGAAGGTGVGGTAANTPLLDTLGALQQGGVMLPDGVRFALPAMTPGSTDNVLRALQASPVMQSSSALDTVIVDAVALLFDVIFDDQRAPDSLKAQVARLQIPVLRVALQDRSLFTRRSHPVRRVLDALARFAPLFGGEETPRSRSIVALIDTLPDAAAADAAFEAAAVGLEALESDYEAGIETSIADEAAQLARDERAELAAVIVHDRLRRALVNQGVPAALREFVFEDWATLLRRDYVEEGEDSAALKADLDTIVQLVWSVSPKPDAEARLALVRALPGLLKSLRAGCERAELPAARSDHLFAALVGLHANAVRPGGAAACHAGAPADPLPPPAPLPAVKPVAMEQDEYHALVLGLACGDWLEFRQDDGTFRAARLSWISQSGTTFLFSDTHGAPLFSVGLDRLAAKLRAGLAARLETEAVTASAFEKLLLRIKSRLGS